MRNGRLTYGTDAPDELYSMFRNDTVLGFGGDDVLGDTFVQDWYRPSHDVYLGMEGNDTLITRDGRDRLFGNSGDDEFYYFAHAGKVRINGGEGEDTLYLRSIREDFAEVIEVGNRTIVTDESGRHVVFRNVEHFDFG